MRCNKEVFRTPRGTFVTEQAMGLKKLKMRKIYNKRMDRLKDARHFSIREVNLSPRTEALVQVS